MATSVEFDVAARAEFDDAFDWYAHQNLGAAIGFASEVDAAVDLITADPGHYPGTYAGCQCCALRRYPYRVIYYRTQSRVIIVAVAHAKRRPGYWRSRL